MGLHMVKNLSFAYDWQPPSSRTYTDPMATSAARCHRQWAAWGPSLGRLLHNSPSI